ncbi:MAG: hypothetical protein E2O61_14095 [Gammaproteobacteria bacterium]|nr:MAG: hypothetical protein E2O59_13935 [Gammaproteobacteria bacterium]TDJ32353.1 MAG: hypothetical protein E2O61_14095 [Gammaproteobacteria bacterium]
MYRTLLLVCGVYYLAMGIFGAISSSMWLLHTFTFDVHPGSAQMLAFATGFAGLLIITCATINESSPRALVCIALIVGHLWNLSAHVFNYIEGYEANLAAATLVNLLVVVVAIIVITRVMRPALPAQSSQDKE